VLRLVERERDASLLLLAVLPTSPTWSTTIASISERSFSDGALATPLSKAIARRTLGRVRKDSSGVSALEAWTRSLPMFKSHVGFCGVLFAADGEERVVITLWSERAAVETLERSPRYRNTAAATEEAGFLRPPQRVELFESTAPGPRA
jgi:heme-degrading monooxygenase HmoA